MMSIARLTGKGQVTIPVQVRKALDIEAGDALIFEVTGIGEAQIRVVKRRKLTDLYGILPAAQPYPGKDVIRAETAQILGKQLDPDNLS
ncbi:MAG: AbrB/MazE/SpoVT family DNA-binding domain-containing protein [Chloroflexota bacterium]